MNQWNKLEKQIGLLIGYPNKLDLYNPHTQCIGIVATRREVI